MSNVLKRTGYRNLEGAFRIQSRYSGQSLRADDEVTETVALANDAIEQSERGAKRRAEEILKEAAREAECIQAEAKQAIESWWNEQREQDHHYKEEIRRKAYDEGYRQGYESGIGQAQQEIEEQLKKAQQIVESAYIAKEQIISEAEPFLVRLSLDIAEKVVARQIELDRTVVVDMVHRALEYCFDTGPITVLIKPEYFPLVQEARDELKQYLNEHTELKIVPDRTLESDGCVIRSQKGSIDARADVQLDQIKKVLMEVAKEGEPSVDGANYEIPADPAKTESDSC